MSMKFASFLASLHHFYGFYGFLNLYEIIIFENSSGMKGLNKHPKYISLFEMPNIHCFTGKTPEIHSLINPLMPGRAIWGHIY